MVLNDNRIIYLFLFIFFVISFFRSDSGQEDDEDDSSIEYDCSPSPRGSPPRSLTPRSVNRAQSQRNCDAGGAIVTPM